MRFGSADEGMGGEYHVCFTVDCGFANAWSVPHVPQGSIQKGGSVLCRVSSSFVQQLPYARAPGTGPELKCGAWMLIYHSGPFFLLW